MISTPQRVCIVISTPQRILNDSNAPRKNDTHSPNHENEPENTPRVANVCVVHNALHLSTVLEAFFVGGGARGYGGRGRLGKAIMTIEAADLLHIVHNTVGRAGREEIGAVEADAGVGHGHAHEVTHSGREIADVRHVLDVN